MRTFILTFLLATSLMLVSQTVQAQDRGFGVGAAIGGPDGLSYKAWTGSNSAIAGVLTFNVSDNFTSFYTHADYLIHKFYDELDWEVGNLLYYYGGGVAFQWYDSALDDRLSIRLPGGFGFNFTDVPVDVFLELAPTITVSPEFNFSFNGNMGFRFYLN